MQRSGAITRSAWAERSLAVVALSAALLAAVGGAAGILWLFQDLKDQLWIALAGVAVVAVVAQAALGTLGRRRRRERWDTERIGFGRGVEFATAGPAPDRSEPGTPDLGHHTDLMADLLAEMELVQEQLTALVSQVHGERRSVGSGRHARPVLLDVRTDEDILESGPLDDIDDASEVLDEDFEDEPYGVGNVLRIADRIDLDAAARGRRVLTARDDTDEDGTDQDDQEADDEDDGPFDGRRFTVVDLSAHGTEDPFEDGSDDRDTPENRGKGTDTP